MREKESLRGKIVGATTYPLIIVFFIILAFLVVMVYVVPQLLPIISGLSGELPFTTRSLIAMSDFLDKNIFLLLFLALGAVLIFLGYTQTPSGKYRWDKEKLLFPLTGNVYKNYLVVKTLSTFHLLTSSGISIVKTLRLTGQSAGNSVIAKLFSLVADDVSHGTKISEAMRTQDSEHVFFTPDVLQMIESAERTSTLDTITEKIATQYKREVDVSLGMMVKFIEPAALLLA